MLKEGASECITIEDEINHQLNDRKHIEDACLTGGINVQKIMEIEIPLQKMEQKLEKLENEVARLNDDATEGTIKTICSRIND